MLPLNDLYNMDCMDGMKQFPDGYFDLAIVDPVYGDVTGGGYTTSKYDKQEHHIGTGKGNQLAYHRALWEQPKTGSEYFKELFRVSKNQIIWGGNFFVESLPSSQGWIVWDKQHPDGLTFSDCELAFTSFNVGLRIFRYMWNGMLQGNMKQKEKNTSDAETHCPIQVAADKIRKRGRQNPRYSCGISVKPDCLSRSAL